MKISVVMIVKNEEALLGRCLQSVKDADEIIVVDTGSTDSTVEIAKRFTDKVFTDFTWCDDFAKARNHAKGKATGDYILSIDADEYLHDYSKVVEAVKSGHDSYHVTLVMEGTGQEHLFPRLFKNTPEIQWRGAVHNYLNIGPGEPSDIVITYGNSPAHAGDPDRALRILEREVQDPSNVRELYYLGREYMYKGRIAESILALTEYTKRSGFLPEIADAHLLIARGYWRMGLGENAREACLKAININANFKEALLFMGSMSWEANAKQWHAMAQTADNSNVLFVRVK